MEMRSEIRKTISRCLAPLTCAALLFGCGGDGTKGSAFFVLDWALFYVAGEAVSCENAGAPTVSIVLQDPVSADVEVFSFPCDSHGGTTPPVASGYYDVWVTLQDEDGEDLSEAFLGRVRAARRTIVLPVVEFDVQSFAVSWFITDAQQPGGYLSCAQVGAATMRLSASLPARPPLIFDFPCADMTGVTVGVPIGPYTIAAELLDGAGGVLSAMAPMAFHATAITRSVLPDITFEVN